jgi:hypothetical protein
VAFASDIRYALRSFARTPGITTILVVTIALGVGGNAAMFAFIGGLMSLEVDGAATDATERFGRIAALLAGASALVLFLAGATVSGLLLARARSRAHEMAVRTALGASRTRLARLCLADSIVVSALGGALGVACGWWAAHLFPLLFFLEDAEQLALSPDLLWLGVASAVWLVVLLLSALAPVVPVWRQVPWSVLRQESHGGPGGAVRLRNRLATAQVAVCCLLLLVAGVIRDDLQSTLRTARGLGLGSLLVVGLKGGPSYLAEAEEAVLEHPGVGGIAWASTLPAGRPVSMTFRAEHLQPRPRAIELDASTFDPRDRTADNILPIAGRSFTMHDGALAPRVALINTAAGDRYFDGDALGRLLEAPGGGTLEVIGVLPPRDPDVDERPALFYYAEQVQMPAVQSSATFYTTAELTRPEVEFDVNVVSPTYFTLFADPAIDGRLFEPGDLGGRQVVVIGEAGAEAYFGDEAVGAALVGPGGGRVEVVGVVRAAPLGAAERGGLPALFLLHGQTLVPTMSLAIRASDNSDETRRGLRAALDGIDGGGVVTPLTTFEDHLIRNALAPERLATTLVGVMALGALVLSIAGIHGAMSDLVARRRPELALRVALGARPVRLVAEVVRAGLRLALAGAGAGLGIGILATPVLAYVLGRADLPSLTVLLVALAAVATLVAASSALPAWRAISVDPREVMR